MELIPEVLGEPFCICTTGYDKRSNVIFIMLFTEDKFFLSETFDPRKYIFNEAGCVASNDKLEFKMIEETLCNQ